MANIFPEVFESEVPCPVVAFAATAILFFSDHSFYVLKYRYQIKVALDEIVDGKEVTFKRDIYSDVYIDILSLMAKCDMSTVHRAKTKALRVQWAKIGRYVLLLLNTCHTWYMKCNLVQEWGLSRNNNRV